jgi:SpoVK/Ycf46/Vps4 family AAA+-type ATPase
MHPRPYGGGTNWRGVSSSFGLCITDDGATLILQIAEQFEKFRSGTNGGVIFCGQPGWGVIRCLLAQIDTHRKFICIHGVDMLSMCESAGNVRKVFNFARASSPCVLFIEDLDSIRGRSAANEQFLMELDSAFRSRSDDVFVIASSNKHHVDPELLLPGRLDLQVLVAPATYREMFDKGLTRKNFENHLYHTGLEKDVDLGSLSATYHESHVMTQGGVAIICLQAAKFAIIEELRKLFAPGADKEQDRAQRDGHHRDCLHLGRRHFEQCKHEDGLDKKRNFREICRIERPVREEHCTLKSLAENYPQFAPYQEDPHQEEIWIVSQLKRDVEHLPQGGAVLAREIVGPLFHPFFPAGCDRDFGGFPVRRAAAAPAPFAAAAAAPFTGPLTAEDESFFYD